MHWAVRRPHLQCIGPLASEGALGGTKLGEGGVGGATFPEQIQRAGWQPHTANVEVVLDPLSLNRAMLKTRQKLEARVRSEPWLTLRTVSITQTLWRGGGAVGPLS